MSLHICQYLNLRLINSAKLSIQNPPLMAFRYIPMKKNRFEYESDLPSTIFIKGI